MMNTTTVDIEVQNDHHIQAGSWVKGEVIVDCQGGGINANALELTFHGQEFVEIEIDNNNDDTSDRSETSTRSLIHVKIPVNDMSLIQKGGRIEPGQYRIPFSLELPSFLPGSMVYEASSRSKCWIKYTMKAILKGSGILWNHHKEIPVTIIAKPMDNLPNTTYNAAPVNERVNFCCCFNKGSISLGGQTDNTRLFAGSQCSVTMSCRNYSTAKIHKVQARLRQEIKWSTLGNNRGRTKVVTDTLVAVDFPGILYNIQKEQQHTSHWDQMFVQNELQSMYRELENGLHQGTLHIPPMDVLDTYAGHLITVKHKLELQVKTGCCISDPVVMIPLWMGQPPSDPTTAMATQESYTPPPMVSPDFVQVSAVAVPESDTLPVIHLSNSQAQAAVPSFDLLLLEMKSTVSHLDLIERKIRDATWNVVWQQMTPTQFARVTGLVQMGFDQARVAEALAKEIPSFQCQYVVAVLRTSMDFQRTSIVESLLPHCLDLWENHVLIENELTDWERMVTERCFAKAMSS